MVFIGFLLMPGVIVIVIFELMPRMVVVVLTAWSVIMGFLIPGMDVRKAVNVFVLHCQDGAAAAPPVSIG